MYRNRNFLRLFMPNDAPGAPVADGLGTGGGATPPAPPAPERQADDRGYPEGTPVAQMTDAERANYFKHHNRQAEDRLAAFKGVTPEQIQQMQAELETARNAKLTADELAVKEAVDKAAADARAAAEAELRPQLDRAAIKEFAAGVLQGDALNAFASTVDAKAFYGEDGKVDGEKVMGHLTAMFGTQQQQPPAPQPNWGQYSSGNGAPHTPGSAGVAEAQKRFGIQTSS